MERPHPTDTRAAPQLTEPRASADESRPGLLARRPRLAIAMVVLFFVAVAIAHLAFWPRFTWQIASIATILICIPYLVEAWRRPRFLNVEAAVAVTLIALAVAGGIWWPGWVIIALVGHGLWDLAKHQHSVGVPIPGWYEQVCVVIDIGYALVLVALWIAL